MTRNRPRWALLIVAALPLPLSGCGDNPDTALPHSETASSSSEASASGPAQDTWDLLGFTNYRGWTLVADEPFHAMGYVTADQVFRDPCGSTRHSEYDTARDPGPTVADLAEALVAQKGALTSAPAPVTIDGYAGLYLKYRVSKRVDVAGCEDRAFDIFTTGPGGMIGEIPLSAADAVIQFVGPAASSTRWINWVVEMLPARRT